MNLAYLPSGNWQAFRYAHGASAEETLPILPLYISSRPKMEGEEYPTSADQ